MSHHTQDHRQATAVDRRAGQSQGAPAWNGRCVKCDTDETPMWRAGPDGEKNLCNACGIRWKRTHDGSPSDFEKTIKKRKKKKNGLEALVSPDDHGAIPHEKRQRAKQMLCNDLNVDSDALAASPTSSPNAGGVFGSLERDSPPSRVGQASMDIDGSDEMDRSEDAMAELESPVSQSAPSTAPFPFTRPSESPFQPGAPTQPWSAHMRPAVQVSPISTSLPTGAPFPALSTSPLVSGSGSSVTVERKSDASDATMGVGIDLGLLRQILTRLENLRKEHRKTNDQVKYMMEECAAHPELLCEDDSAPAETPPTDALRSDPESTTSAPFPISSSAPFVSHPRDPAGGQ